MATVNISMNLDVDLDEWARVRDIYKADGSLDLKAAEQDLIDSIVYMALNELHENGVLID